MRKTKFFSLALVMAVALMGSGYAYWTDTLTINNTVSTGELNVVFNDYESFTKGRDETGYPAYVYSDAQSKNGEFASDVIKDGKVFVAKIGNLYPGAWGRVQGRIDNVGTIPAVVDSVEVKFTGKTETEFLTDAEQELVDTLLFTAGYEKFNSHGTHTDGTDKWSWTNGGDLDDSTTGLESKLNTMLSGVRLEPGQYLKLDIPEEHRQEAYAFIG